MRVSIAYIGPWGVINIEDKNKNRVLLQKEIFEEVDLSIEQIKDILSRGSLFRIKPFKIPHEVEEEVPVKKKKKRKILRYNGKDLSEEI